ncbi:DNA-binding CsgD family transcriptional regulator [Streptomyces sp. V4I23]|uniref:helix-turn-helix transcriptional regulator n=1 Tax=Streptomyces sp. V4I23 TaxID=3042282 RepID=UPI002787629B|nr:LuxR C-terminal-related transcriptional regulator [Streptomyces sp. V4I23]MDQ1007708.1 DNA-binding CsgD family transcriptional regulator [Streptomyces sp. V4I23]
MLTLIPADLLPPPPSHPPHQLAKPCASDLPTESERDGDHDRPRRDPDERWEAVLGSARHNVSLVCASDVRPERLRRDAALLKELLRRWVRVSVIWDERLLQSPSVQEYARGLARAGAQMRAASDVPVTFTVVDCDTCVVGPGFGASGPRAASPAEQAVSRCPETVSVVQYLFRGLWDASVNLSADEHGLPNGQTQSVLSMLAQGLTDQQIAHRLKVCERTVGRTVAWIMGELDARSRFDAGVRAARLGWLGAHGRTA